MSGQYKEFEPRADLRPWVRRIWSYADEAPDAGVQLIPPDGCPEFIIHLAQSYEEETASGRFERQPQILFVGQMTRPIRLRAAGPIRCAGVRFEPDAASVWFGAAMSEATDRRMDMTARIARIDSGLKLEDCLDLMQRDVASSLEHAGWPLDRIVREEVRRLEAGAAAPACDAAERRRLQRLFVRHVGVSPQALQSVLRFRKVFDRASAPDAGDWLAIALDAGYFDQPQMARDFRRFLGCTATDWARGQVGIGRAIASQPSPHVSEDSFGAGS